MSYLNGWARKHRAIKPSLLWETGQPVFSTKIPCLAMASSSFSSGKSEDKAFGSTSVDCSFQNMTNLNSKGKPYHIFIYIEYIYIYTYNIYIYIQSDLIQYICPCLPTFEKRAFNILWYKEYDLWSMRYLYCIHSHDFPLLLSVSFGWISGFTRHLRLCSAATIRFHSILLLERGWKEGTQTSKSAPSKKGTGTSWLGYLNISGWWLQPYVKSISQNLESSPNFGVKITK